MTGPEHYREAERLLADKLDGVYGYEWDAARSRNVAEALVHATLAHAAAVAVNPAVTGWDLADWRETAGATS